MLTSGYSLTYRPEKLSPTFFDDLGGIKEKGKARGNYKTYAWIQPGDACLKAIAKIFFACITCATSLWISAAIDRQIEKKKIKGFFNQTTTDLFRHVIKIDGKNLYEIGWEHIKKDQISRESLTTQKPTVWESEDTQLATKLFVQNKILPKLFQRLEKKHGTLRAMQIHDGLSQRLSIKMGHYLFNTFFSTLAEELNDLHFNCHWKDTDDSVPLEELNLIDNETLFFYQNYRFCTVDKGKQTTKIRIELKLTLHIRNLDPQLEITFYPFGTLTLSEAELINQVWEPIGFKMPLPA